MGFFGGGVCMIFIVCMFVMVVLGLVWCCCYSVVGS